MEIWATSQRLQLDLACGPRCMRCKHGGSGRPHPDMPKAPSRETVFGNQDAIAQRSSRGLVSPGANRSHVEYVAAAPAGENDASVPIRLLIPTPAQRVSSHLR
jgi:hypothetical protein